MTSRRKLVLCVLLWMSGVAGVAQGVDVTAKLVATSHPGFAARKGSRPLVLRDVALWLTRVDDAGSARTAAPPKTAYRLLQKNKMFSPHLLVVPAGSSVEFPNLDPFFHNVFSLFNGRRFDLGLYEIGARRAVRFEHEGVSYIFCNIHPEMGAIVLAVGSPYFGVSDANGAIAIHDVPPGKYRLHIWGEQFQADDSAVEHRIFAVSAENTSLGSIPLTYTSSPLAKHKNKFGEDYPAVPTPAY